MKKIKIITIVAIILITVFGSVSDVNSEYRKVENSYSEIADDIEDVIENTLVIVKIAVSEGLLSEKQAAKIREQIVYTGDFRKDYATAVTAMELAEKYTDKLPDAKKFFAELEESSNIIRYSNFKETAENYNSETGTLIGSVIRAISGKSKIDMSLTEFTY